MTTQRLDVRLDAEHMRRLREVADTEGAPLSEVVRRLIDSAYEDIQLSQRLAAVAQIAAANVEDVPDPDELSRQLEETYEPGGVFY